jgi:hypothetical protein
MKSIQPWLEAVYKFVSERTSCGQYPIDAAGETWASNIVVQHAEVIKEVRSVKQTREQFIEMIASCLSGYATSNHAVDAVLIDAVNFIFAELHPTVYEAKLVQRAMRIERQSDFPPTLKNIRDAFVEARRQINRFTFMLQSIDRMMSGKRALPFGGGGSGQPLELEAPPPLPQITYEPRLDIIAQDAAEEVVLVHVDEEEYE